MIAVNLAKLAQAAEVAEWTEPLNNDRQRMAARVVTDFIGCAPDVAISNATSWIDRAYDAGQAAGIALERQRWNKKICEIFDIPVVNR